MPVPGHKPDCETYIYKITCPDCGQLVWLFGCSCGSKVFFNEIGPPWPRHADTCWKYQIRLLLQEGKSPDQIKALIYVASSQNGDVISDEVKNYLQKISFSGSLLKNEILPSTNYTDICGTLKEIHQCNIFKRLDIPHNIFMERVLGRFGNRALSELVVQSPATRNNMIDQWTFLVETVEVDGYNLCPGMTVFATLIGERIFDGAMYWVADSIDWK